MNTKNYCLFLPDKEEIKATFCKPMVPGIDGCFKPVLRCSRNKKPPRLQGLLEGIVISITQMTHGAWKGPF